MPRGFNILYEIWPSVLTIFTNVEHITILKFKLIKQQVELDTTLGNLSK
jgi:hypothetical protein